MTSKPQQPELETELVILGEILMSRTVAECEQRIAALTQHCTGQLWSWFTGQMHRVVAVGITEAIAGRCEASSSAIIERMGSFPRDDLQRLRNGHSVDYSTRCQYEASALAWAGGYGVAGDLPRQAMDVMGSRDVEVNARRLRAIGQRRQAVQASEELTKRLLASSPDESPAILAAAQDQITALLSTTEDRSLGHCLTDAMAAGEAYAAMRDLGGRLEASWGIRALDLLCPLRPGAVYILAAEPGGGKTTLALQAAKETAEAVGIGAVALASLEMTGQELATILAGRQAGISPAAIRERSASILESDWARLAELAKEWTDSPGILVRDSSATGDPLTVDGLSAWLTQRRHAAPRMGLAVLDYLQLLDAPNPRWTEYQTITHASRKLKRTAQALRIPILCLSQMNRKGREAIKDKSGAVQGTPEPTLNDLRGSGSIEQDADAVIFLHVVGNPEPSAPTVLVRAIVAKQRGGAKGSVDLWFHRAHARLSAAEIRIAPDNSAAAQSRAERIASSPSDDENVFG